MNGQTPTAEAARASRDDAAATADAAAQETSKANPSSSLFSLMHRVVSRSNRCTTRLLPRALQSPRAPRDSTRWCSLSVSSPAGWGCTSCLAQTPTMTRDA